MEDVLAEYTSVLVLQLSDDATKNLPLGLSGGPNPAMIAAVRSSLGQAFVPRRA